MQNDRFYRMLGLAARAGGIAFGEGAVRDSIRKGDAYLVIVSQDASENTKKKFRDNCSFYNVSYKEAGDRFSLGKYTGRAFAVVLAVKIEGLAENIKGILDSE